MENRGCRLAGMSPTMRAGTDAADNASANARQK